MSTTTDNNINIEDDNNSPLLNSSIIVGEDLEEQKQRDLQESNELQQQQQSSRPISNWNIISTSNPPSPRFDCTVVSYKNQLYLFGGSDGTTVPQGFSTFLKLDLQDFSWQSTTCTFKTRVLHTAVIHKDAMYIFGGGLYEDERTGFWSTEKVFKTINNLLKYDFIQKEWSELLPATPTTPPLNPNGGTINNATTSNDEIYVPECRDGHSSVVVDNEIFIIGGSQTVTSIKNKKVPIISLFFTHADVYDITMNKWRSIQSPRFGRLCSSVHYRHLDGNQYIYVFGGYDAASKGSSDLWKLDLQDFKWSLVKPNGSVKIPERYGHSANVYQDKMYIYGGYSKSGFLRDFYSFDFGKEEWLKIETNGPPKRRRHNSVLVEHQGKSKLLLYGGTYLSCLYNDLWEYCFPSEVYIPSDSLINDFSLLFQNPLEYFSDITFKTIAESGDGKIHAHKSILSVRSPYFKGLFTSGLKESFEREIVIQEKYEDFKVLLEFLYTGKESLVQLENCIGLLYLSDLYCIPRLKTICESKATEGIDCETVVDIFKQADFYKLSKLRKISLNFIARHNKELNENGTMKQLDSNVLLEIIQYLEVQTSTKK